VNHVLPAWDIACAFQAAFAIVAAAERRRRSAQGAELRLALSDVAFSMLSHLGVAGEAELLGQDRPRIGNHIYGAFGRDFGTADGRRVMVAAISSAQWAALVKSCAIEPEIEALQERVRLDFEREADRYAGREAIARLVETWCAARTLEQVQAAFEQHRVCWGLYRTTTDLLAKDSRVGPGNPVWERIATTGIGVQLVAGTPVRANGEVREATSPAPLLGEHTDAVLLEVLGLTSEAVGRLHDAGIVAGSEQDPSVSRAR
jgi:2-methylfumaryl-CoA isomerase